MTTMAPRVDILRHATGRPGLRSAFLGHPGGSALSNDACGPCRQRGNRPERDSHPGLDGAQNAPPTTAHKAYLSSVDEKNKARKMTRLQSEGGSRDTLLSSLRSDE